MTRLYDGAVPAGGENDGTDDWTQFKELESPHWEEADYGWVDYL